jgi:hypothetical protein
MPSPNATTAAAEMSIAAGLDRPTMNLEGTATL